MTDTNIVPIPLTEALSERYLSYALSTIVSRSLPDVRDGLKPVQRRLLYAMRQMRLSPGSGPKKAARVVGDVIGRYHPHGEVAVYDTLVRLAQDFAQRYPLVDGQGNFGNVDGDGAAAMRYTEARLTEVAELLLAGIDEDTVDFRDTYDGEDAEPVVLPAAFPNLLANGVQGIAVGMATSIPPHNAAEICDALLHLIDHREAETADLLRHMKGPDFPTGGVLVEPADQILAAYETGRGSFRLRARWETEKLAQGQFQIVVTEIPYQVPKARLVERIADLLANKKLPLLEDVRDESSDDVRLVLVPRSRNVEAEILMEQLYRQSDLEVRVPLNMNVLDGGTVPRVMALKETLSAFLDHRHTVLLRRTRHCLARIANRLEVLDGYLVAFLNIDEVIAIIRSEDEPKPALMQRFGLTETQAEAVLNLRLRALRRLEEMEIRGEHDRLSAEQADLTALLQDAGRRWTTIGEEIRAVREQFGPDTELGRRRTGFADAPTGVVVPVSAVIEREPITVYLSQQGWLRAVRGHQPFEEGRYKEGDGPLFAVHAETTDRLLMFASDGRFFTLPADKLPRGRGFGEPVRLMVDLANEASVVALLPARDDQTLLVAASDGRGFQVRSTDAVAQTRAGRQVLNLASPATAAVCIPVQGDMVAVVGTNRKLLCFPLAEIPEMARGRGVILQRYRDARLSDITVFVGDEGLSWRLGERTRTETDFRAWLGRRAGVGKLPPKGFPKTGKFT